MKSAKDLLSDDEVCQWSSLWWWNLPMILSEMMNVLYNEELCQEVCIYWVHCRYIHTKKYNLPPPPPNLTRYLRSTSMALSTEHWDLQLQRYYSLMVLLILQVALNPENEAFLSCVCFLLHQQKLVCALLRLCYPLLILPVSFQSNDSQWESRWLLRRKEEFPSLRGQICMNSENGYWM